MTLNQWVKRYGGAEKVARELKITGAGVRVWLRKEKTPRPKRIAQLIKLSKGQLTFESILTSTQK